MGSSLALVSSQDSYVQHIQWVGEAALAESYLMRVADQCANDNVRIQVCLPGLCAAEDAFGTRLGAPATSARTPGLRICVSADHTVDDLSIVGKVLLAAFGIAPSIA